MSRAEKPLVYLFLGASHSGRREVLVDLIEDGLAEDDRPAVLLAESEASSAYDVRLPSLMRWSSKDGAIEGEWPEDATHVFFVVDGRANPIDQIEAFKNWIQMRGGEFARAICVVNCQLAEKNPPLLAWYEACVHFADVVLLHRREGVANKWMSDFRAHFADKFYPCLFELVKGGRVKNPALVLEPEARRMSHVFDEETNWVVTDAEGEELDETEAAEGEEEVAAAPEEDPYMKRRPNGQREKPLPDIARFLEPRVDAGRPE